MTTVDFIGWIASALVLVTFYVKTMIPLRCVAIASNVAFIGYGLMAGTFPIVVLHVFLLPMNVLRLHEMRSLIRRVKRASCGTSLFDMLVPYMEVHRLSGGTKLFEKGDYAEEMFLVLNGRVRIVESGVFVKTGELLGEMGIFAPGQKRTATAVCDSDVELASIADDKIRELFYQNPEFSAHLIRLILRRQGDIHEDSPVTRGQRAPGLVVVRGRRATNVARRAAGNGMRSL